MKADPCDGLAAQALASTQVQVEAQRLEDGGKDADKLRSCLLATIVTL